MRVNRRTVVKLAGAALTLPVVGTAGAQDDETTTETQPTDETTQARPAVETVVAIRDEDRVPENLAVDGDGTLYFGITAGEVWAVSAEQTQETGLTLDDIEQVATLPGSAIGVEVGPDGTLYVASQADAGTGVWRVPRDGGDPGLFAAIPAADGDQAFPNDVLYDADDDRLLVTESFAGRVYEVPLDASDPETAASVWVDADALDTESFGANGLALGPDGAVFVAVTRAASDAGEDVGRLVRVPVAEDGSAGDATTYFEGPGIFGADGITTRDQDVYVAANSLNEVVVVTPDQETTTLASGDDGLVFPSDVAFGTTDQQQDDLFVCNFANENPTEGAILRTTVEDS
ncbi:SMP-30/gluconolactonase/LRE family protein [Halobacteriaceae archaeon GCM10025711]